MRAGAGVRSATVVIGREIELDVLSRAVSGARAGVSSCTVVVGEGGVGKTRLLSELVATAHQLGLGVAVGRAPVSAPAPFSVMAEALRSWLRGHPRDALGTPFDRGVQLVLPEWPVTNAPGDLTPVQLRLLAFEGVVRLVRELVDDACGAVVVLDDLHGADADSVEAVRYLVSAGVEGLAVVVAMRPGASALADELVRAVRGERSTTVIDLRPLDAGGVGSLVAELLEAEPPPELVAEVVARTDGVPLLVEEVVDAHVLAGSVVVDAGSATWRGASVIVPRSVRDMVTARLRRVGAPLADVVLACAVLGTAEPTRLLTSVANVDEATVSQALRTGTDAGLLAIRSGTVVFRHDIIRQAVLDTALPQVVAALHARAAEALVGEGTDVRRAGHLVAAGEREDAAKLLARVALDELAAHAPLSAERLALEAQDLALSTPTRHAASDALATVLAAQGRWAEALEVDDATSASGGATEERRHRMASAALEAGFVERAEALLGDCDASAPLTRVLAGRIALVRGDGRAALDAAEAVLAARVDSATRLTALDIKGRALDFLGDRTAANDTWTCMAEEAAAGGRTEIELRALLQLGKQEFFTGKAPVKMREAVRLATEAGALVELAWAEELLATALVLQGDPVSALEVLDAAVARARDLRLDQLAFLIVAQGAAMSYVSPERAEPLLAEAEALLPAPDLLLSTTTVRAMTALHSGDYAEAVRRYEAADAALTLMPGVAPADSTCMLVWALAAAGRLTEAAAVLRRAEAAPDLARWHTRPVLVGAARALLAGDPEGIDRAILSAAGPMPFEVAVMRVISAEVLGGENGARWLREALDIYERTGAVALSERLRRLLRNAGAPVPRRRRTAEVPAPLAGHGVTAREAEVLRLLAAGLSNAEIAGTLFLSVRTVETHVSSLLAKLHARSRGQLIALSATLAESG